MDKIEKIIKYGQYILIFLFIIIYISQIIQIFNNSNPIGDESYYLMELNRFRNDGLWKSFSSGISHLYILLSYLFSFITKTDLLSLRIINVLILPITIYLMWLIIKIIISNKDMIKLALLTSIFLLICTKTGGMFFAGINDPLMILLALSSMYFLLKYNNSLLLKDLIIASLFSGMMLWVRSFSIIIMGGYLAWIFLFAILKSPFWKNFGRAVIYVLIIVLIALIPQIPSLLENGEINFEHKGGNEHNWEEMNWLTRVKRYNSGSIFAYKRPTWEEVDEYKRIYGENSLPHGLKEKFKIDPKFMIDNFVVNVCFRVPYILLVSIGFFFLSFLNYLRLLEKWCFKKNRDNLLLLLTTLSVWLGVSLVIINYVEHRWQFMTAFCTLVLGAESAAQFQKQKYYNILIILQYSFLIIMSTISVFKLLL